jgi:class 3 adenylate cyclase
MATEQSYDDPFIQPGLDENERQEALRKYRIRKTRDSIVKLSGGLKLTDLEQELGTPSGSSDEGDEDNMYFTDAIPPATRHDCALLFVDISGFTKLSTTLAVEPLSKVSLTNAPLIRSLPVFHI